MSNSWNAFRKANPGLKMAELRIKYRESKEKPIQVLEKAEKVKAEPKPDITSSLINSSMWSKSARFLHQDWTDCSMDQRLFFKFTRWLSHPDDEESEEERDEEGDEGDEGDEGEEGDEGHDEDEGDEGDDNEGEDEGDSEGEEGEHDEGNEEEEGRKEGVDEGEEGEEGDEGDEKSEETAEDHSEAEQRQLWLMRNGWTGDPKWMCDFVGQKLEVPSVTVLGLIGVGLRSFVAMVLHKGSKRAMRVTHASTHASSEERAIQELLSSKGIAPRIVHRESTGKFNIEIMEAVVATLDQFITTVHLDAGVAKEMSQILLHILANLRKVNVMHGDLHINNIGVTADGTILVFDFDQSTVKYWLPGFDLATLYAALHPDGFDINKQFLVALRNELLPHIDKRWLSSRQFDEDKIDHARQLWKNFVTKSTAENRKALDDYAGPFGHELSKMKANKKLPL